MHRGSRLRRKNARRRNAEQRPDAFAAGEHAVTHRLVNRIRRRRVRRQDLLQRGFDGCVVLLKLFWKLHWFPMFELCYEFRARQDASRLTSRLPRRTAPPPPCRRFSSAEFPRGLPLLRVASGTRAKASRLPRNTSSLRRARGPRFPGVSPLLPAARATFRSRPSSAGPRRLCSEQDSSFLIRYASVEMPRYFWQPLHQKVDRPPCSVRRIVPSLRRHFLPSRPYTLRISSIP